MMAPRTHLRSRKVVDRRLLRGSGGKDSRKKIKKYSEYIWIDRLLKIASPWVAGVEVEGKKMKKIRR